MKKYLALLLSMICIFTLSGCSVIEKFTKDSGPEDTVNGFLNAVKKDDVAVAKTFLIKPDDFGTLTNVAKNINLGTEQIDRFITRYTNISFSIQNTKDTDDVNKKIVYVNLEVPDYSEAFSKALNAAEVSKSNEEILKNIMEALANSNPKTIKKATAVAVVKQDDKWLIDSKEENFELHNAISGNLMKSLHSNFGV